MQNPSLNTCFTDAMAEGPAQKKQKLASGRFADVREEEVPDWMEEKLRGLGEAPEVAKIVREGLGQFSKEVLLHLTKENLEETFTQKVTTKHTEPLDPKPFCLNPISPFPAGRTASGDIQC